MRTVRIELFCAKERDEKNSKIQCNEYKAVRGQKNLACVLIDFPVSQKIHKPLFYYRTKCYAVIVPVLPEQVRV